MQKKDFPALTGIRFVAASLVFFCHYPALIVSPERFPFFFFFIRQLNVGVNLFFVLSGFLITYRYYEMPLHGKGLKTYLVKRFIRIFPLYFLLLLVCLFFRYRLGNAMNMLEVFMNISLLKGLSSQYIFSGIPQSWSLTVEEMFYALAPLSFYLIRKKNWFFVQVPVLLAIGVLLVIFFNAFPFKGFFSDFVFLFSATFFGRCFEFFTGMYLALLVMKKRRTPFPGFRFFTFAGSLLFLFLMILQGYYAYRTHTEAVNKTPLGILLFNFTIPLSIGLLYHGLLHEKTRLQAFLASSPVVLLGKSSYAFYLLHLGFFAEVIYFHLTSNWFFLYIILQLLSIAFYKAFEKPVYFLLLQKFLPSRKPVLKTEAVQ